MVTIAEYKQRTNKEGEPFFALILEGDIEMVKSKSTGNFYATARRASITSTFNEAICKRMVGKTMPGSIKKVACDPYEYTVPESGEIITLTHRYEYVPEEAPEPSEEDAVFERQNGVAG